MVLAHPAGDEREKGKPEEQMQVGPHEPGTHCLAGLEEVMVIVPVDAEINEAQHISQKDGQERPERGQIRAVRHAKLQHHDGDDDRQNTITECLKSVGLHGNTMTDPDRRSAISSIGAYFTTEFTEIDAS